MSPTPPQNHAGIPASHHALQGASAFTGEELCAMGVHDAAKTLGEKSAQALSVTVISAVKHMDLQSMQHFGQQLIELLEHATSARSQAGVPQPIEDIVARFDMLLQYNHLHTMLTAIGTSIFASAEAAYHLLEGVQKLP